ncbi:uncharacterized protein CG5098 [Malaya genurostris]|uniref:uncharacterized protein CG5098 n=1 Tax=Malaya genurostris TaxID=325434 RepID=UPI0026F3D6C7|nr:uncharacterized protein CG5098 [Malaya genurostris]XP_058459809.1 uncharacterized protein CG5098 [Malaya genurostris]
MSGHNPPHGRLGQPNSTWNPLQVPSYIPRQPQLAHMSSERSLARSPLTWHTPPTHQDQLYNFMTANHKTNLEINPMLPTFGRGSGMPLGSVDLSLSSASRSTPSPKGSNHQPPGPHGQQQHPSSMPPGIIPPVLGGPLMPDQNDHFHPKMVPGHGSQQQQPPHHLNMNHNRSPSANQSGGVIQSTAALKDRSGHGLMGSSAGVNSASGNTPTSCSFLGNSGSNSLVLGSGSAGGNGYYNMMSSNSSGNNNNACVGGGGGGNSINNRSLAGPAGGTAAPSSTMGGMVGDLSSMLPGGLHIKDTKQINNEVSGRNGKDNAPPNTDSSDLVKDIIMHAMQSTAVSVSPKQDSSMRLPAPPAQSPVRSRSPPMVNSSVDKSFPTISANVPSTPVGVKTADIKASSCSSSSSSTLVTPATPPVATEAINNDRTSPNQSITSSEDSADSNSSKSRRRRKPDRTNKMDSGELERMHDFLVGGDNCADKCDRIEGIDPMRPNIAVRNDIATLTLEGISSLSQGLASDNSHSPHITDLSDSTRIHLQNLSESNSDRVGASVKPPTVSSVISSVLSAAAAAMESARKDSESNSDDCETIDKIAAMISSTEIDTAPAPTAPKPTTDAIAELMKNDNESGSMNGPMDSQPLPPAKGSLTAESDKSQLSRNEADESYEEIENKLEEMFAGIEETSPSCSKTSPTTTTTEKKLSSPSKQSSEPTDILVQLSEKTEESAITDLRISSAEATEDSPEPSTSGTQKKVLTPATKKTVSGKASGNSGASPNKKKKILKKKPNQNKGTSFAAAEERAASFSSKFNKKSSAKGNGKKGNGSGSTASKNVKLKTSDCSGLIDPNGKHKGPFVQVKSDGSHVVINTPINEDDTEKAQNKTKKFTTSMNSTERSKIRGLHVSTLSTKYDADTTDTSWMCVFCKVGPHKTRLGDLFGPYIISTKSSEFEQSQTDEDFFNIKRTRDSLASKLTASGESSKMVCPPKSKKRKINDVTPGTSETTNSVAPGPIEDMFYGMIKAGDDSYEVWMHEECLVWAPGVHIVGTRIVGLEAAIWNCCRHQCRLCSLYGAMVSCLHRGCNEEAHVVCARKNNWKLGDEFKSCCAQHSNTNS